MSNFSNNFLVKKSTEEELIIESFNKEEELYLELENDSLLTYKIIVSDELKSLKIHAKLEENAKLDIYLVDFSDTNTDLRIVIDLNGRNSKTLWNGSVLSHSSSSKNFNVIVNHENENTISKTENFGVVINESRLKFDGNTVINKNASQSEVKQIAKIIVYDEKCVAIANPKLIIDNNDVIASHSAAVGTLNESHVFYLQSKGVPYDEARKLITYGYLTPTLNAFEDEKKNSLISMLGGKF